ncbi:MAG: type III-B CRISPR module-associated protein Cmr3 [Clostridia bacterium]|nr:type III-B CRISPR module-associated protein Cmr3 [Clostridia bacterium]
MTVWVIEARDPLIFRDGRPFDAVPGTRAVSLPFPFPSTTAGALRTRAGQDGEGRFQKDAISWVKQIAVHGPLLVELDKNTGDIARWLVHSPSDALLLEPEPPDGARAALKRLVPLEAPPDVHTDLPEGLSLVGMPKPDFRKPIKKAPRYWYWEAFEEWLVNPEDQSVDLEGIGHDGPTREARVHVGIDPETGAADVEKGALFQTRGLEFTRPRGGSNPGDAHRLALAVATETLNLPDGLGFLGGERRLAVWRKSDSSLPACPDRLKSHIRRNRHCRVVLLTDAHFETGWRPTWLLNQIDGVTPGLKAIAIGRPHVVSGWDMAERGPKPARRLAPAGTVLFLELSGDDDAIDRWVDRIWLSPVSDGEQDRLDGFGLAALGVWYGTLQRMEV